MPMRSEAYFTGVAPEDGIGVDKVPHYIWESVQEKPKY